MPFAHYDGGEDNPYAANGGNGRLYIHREEVFAVASSTERASTRISIQPARLDQAETVARLIRQSFAQYRKDHRGPESAFWTGRRVRRDIGTGHADYWLAYAGRRPVGAVRLRWVRRSLFFSRLSVLPGYRRRGIGKRLMHRVESQARARRVTRIRGQVLRSLPKLILYYRKLGYEIKREKSGLAVAHKGLKRQST